MLHQVPPVGLSDEAMSPNASASPKASQLLSTCMAMPASSPPVSDDERTGDETEGEAVEEDRGALADTVGERRTANAEATTATQRDRNRPPNAWVR